MTYVFLTKYTHILFDSITKLMDKYNNIYENITKNIDQSQSCKPDVVYWLYIKRILNEFIIYSNILIKKTYKWFIKLYCICHSILTTEIIRAFKT